MSKQPVLILFSRFGHMKDIPLSGTMTFGRRTGGNDADIPVPAFALAEKQGVFTVRDGRVFYRDLCSDRPLHRYDRPVRDTIALKHGEILTASLNEGGSPDFTALFLNEEGSRSWSEEILSSRSSLDLSGDGRLCLKKDNGLWFLHIETKKPVCLTEPVIFRTKDTVYYFTGEKLITGTLKPAAVPDDSLLKIRIRQRLAEDGKTPLLKDIALGVPSGSLVLVLGGSGAGKTTFLHAVMGYEQAEGRIEYGGKDLYADYDQFRSRIGYVPQKDLLRDGMTVCETLQAAVEMKAPEKDPFVRIQELLELFGLEREQNTLAAKLSGGQRKRLSIAVEFAGDPVLFFLDEPDTGLDAVMSAGLMQNLRTIADMGKIVFVITHSPDRCIELFDRVIVIARSDTDGAGHLAFCGTVPEALEFFRAGSMEEIVHLITRRQDGGEGQADACIRAFAQRRDV